MDIVALSMAMSQYSVKQDAGIAVMKIAMDTGKENASAMTEIIQTTATNPNVGQNLDVWA